MGKNKNKIPPYNKKPPAAVKSQPPVTSFLDIMKDGNEYQSIIGLQNVNVDMATELRRSINEITTIRKRPFVYEIMKKDDTLSLRFIEREREGNCPDPILPAVMIADLTKAYDLNKQPLLDASELEFLLPQTVE